MNITITLTEDEANALYDAAQRAMELIEAETVQSMIDSGELKEGCMAHIYPNTEGGEE